VSAALPIDSALPPSDRTLEARRLIDAGRQAGSPEEMFRLYEAAHRFDLNDPTAMSLHGMALAVVKHRYQQGIVFCEEAVRRQGPSPALLVNLAKAYLAATNKREAVRCLRRALARSNGLDERAKSELYALGLRRPPVLTFLPRSFFLNRILGRLRHVVLERRSANREDGLRPVPAELGVLSGDLDAANQALSAPEPKTDE
jgi:tetratricopeptide (TPR) repeat protein